MIDIKDTLKWIPNWKPLESLVFNFSHNIDIDNYMYMGTVDIGKQTVQVGFGVNNYKSVTINLYKHRWSRNYINIDNDGRCWRYFTRDQHSDKKAEQGYYLQISTPEAIQRAEAVL